MAYELIYTSAPSGLAQGSSGFCVVACTKGMNLRLTRQLEAMSAYKPLYPHYADNAWDNPVSHSHCTFDGNGTRQHILSRICFNGVDYTGRSNKLASHLVLSTQETATAAAGPASLFLQDGLFKDASWEINVEHFVQQRPIPKTQVSSVKCSTWEQLTGDAGWGGFLAQSYLENPNKRVYISYLPSQHDKIIHLINEALNLLPEDKRWEVSFNTYFVTLPAGVNCLWRACPADSEAMISARRSPLNIVIELNSPGELTAEGALIDAARTGILPAAPAAETVRKLPEEVEITLRPMALQSNSPVQQKPVIIDDAIMLPPATPPRSTSGGRSKLLWIIIPVLCLILLGGGGAWYISYRQNQKFVEGNAKCKEFSAMLESVRARRLDINSRVKNITSSKGCDILLTELRELIDYTNSIKNNLGLLDIYERVFRSRTPITHPEDLNTLCVTLIGELESDIRSLRQKKSELSAKEEARKKAPPAKKEEKKEEKKKAPPVKKEEKKKAPPKKPAVPVKQIPAENFKFLWKKPLSSLRKKGDEIRIVLGTEIKPEDVRLVVDGNTSRIGADLKIVGGDDFGNDVIIYSQVRNGVLIISHKRRPPSQHLTMSLKVKDKLYPMFFRADYSTIVPITKDELTITTRSNGRIFITYPTAALALPDKIFLGKRVIDSSRIRFFLQIGNQEYHLEKRVEKGIEKYTTVTELSELQKIQARQRAFNRLESDWLFHLARNKNLLDKVLSNDKKRIKEFTTAYNRINNNYKAKKVIIDFIDRVNEDSPLEVFYHAARKDTHCELNGAVAPWLKEVKKFLSDYEDVVDMMRDHKACQLKYILKKSPVKEFAESSRTIKQEAEFIAAELTRCINDFKNREFTLFIDINGEKFKQYLLSDKSEAKK